MRFLQTSDVRLGLNTESGRRWGRDRVVERAETLKQVAAKAAETSCELLVIAGDLFSHQPVTSELEEVNRLFLSLAHVQIVLIAGRDDCIRASSPVRSFRWADNVHFVRSGAPEALWLPQLNVTVCAVSDAEGTEERREEDAADASPDASLNASPNASSNASPIRRLAAFVRAQKAAGTLQGLPFLAAYAPDPDEAQAALSDCPFAYAALGGCLQQGSLLSGRAHYSGGLEPVGMNDGGEHGVLIGDLSSATGELIKLSFVPLAKTSYVPLAVRVTEQTSEQDFLSVVEKEIASRGEKNIYRIRITGKRDPDTQYDLSSLEQRFRVTEVIDETQPQYDFAALFSEHSEDIIGAYISRLERSRTPRSELETRAMYYAVDALLKTANRKGSSV